MRYLVNVIVALALIWPVPLAIPAALAVPAKADVSHAIHVDASQHEDHDRPMPLRHDSGHMPDCCIGAACFGLGLTEAIGVPFIPPRAQLSGYASVHLAAISHPPDPPPPRL